MSPDVQVKNEKNPQWNLKYTTVYNKDLVCVMDEKFIVGS